MSGKLNGLGREKVHRIFQFLRCFASRPLIPTTDDSLQYGSQNRLSIQSRRLSTCGALVGESFALQRLPGLKAHLTLHQLVGFLTLRGFKSRGVSLPNVEQVRFIHDISLTCNDKYKIR